MQYRDEFQREDYANALAASIREIPLNNPINLMEVCGTHTHAIARYGIKAMLPEKINLLSGPGCPVCVTSNDFIDHAIALASIPDVIITTFGDMFRVPGSYSSLQVEKGKGARVKIVYSATDALEVARNTPDRKVIFLGVGFETTVPTIGATIFRAATEGITNFFVLCGFKTLPSALDALACLPKLNLHGLIAPGHLSVVTGTRLYQTVLDKYGIPSVVTGFEALDILEGIRMLAQMISDDAPQVAIEYSRAVRPEGNRKAMEIIDRVFRPVDSCWRGMGVIPGSGLTLREEYSGFDAAHAFSVEVPPPKYQKGCICGRILTGTGTPLDCPNFGGLCTPENPIGACMVSSEGTCAAYFRYGDARYEDRPRTADEPGMGILQANVTNS